MIYAGVVLKEVVTITHEEVVVASREELEERYGWVGEAPNLQSAHDVASGSTRIRSGVPCITSLVRADGHGSV